MTIFPNRRRPRTRRRPLLHTVKGIPLTLPSVQVKVSFVRQLHCDKPSCCKVTKEARLWQSCSFCHLLVRRDQNVHFAQ